MHTICVDYPQFEPTVHHFTDSKSRTKLTFIFLSAFFFHSFQIQMNDTLKSFIKKFAVIHGCYLIRILYYVVRCLVADARRLDNLHTRLG